MMLTQEEREYLESPIDDTALEIIHRLSAEVKKLEAEVKTAWGEAGDNMRNGVDLIKGLQAELSIAQGFQVAKQDEVDRLSARVEELEKENERLNMEKNLEK